MHFKLDIKHRLLHLDSVEVSLEQCFAGQLRGLPNPARHEFLVEQVVLVDVEISHVLMFGLDWGEWTQRPAVEEGHLNVPREAMVAEEPAPALDAIKG